MLTRRQFLASSLGAGAALGLPRIARGVPATLGDSVTTEYPRKILEVFLQGGFSPFRSFFYDPGISGEDEPTWADFDGGLSTTPLTWMHGDTLGESAQPLYTAGLLDGCRVVVMKHDLEPHEAAVPYAITGTKLGRPKFASLAAAVSAKCATVDGARGGVTELPAIVLDTGSAVAAGYAAEPGSFGAAHRAPIVRMGDPNLIAWLDRTASGTNASRSDGIRELLLERYRAGLVHPSGAVRSGGFDAFDSAAAALRDKAAVLRERLLLTPYLDAPARDDNTWTNSQTRTALAVAAQLLQTGTYYACVIDSGVYSDYDTHDSDRASTRQAGNLWNLCDALAAVAGDLSDVMIVLNTEFGRWQDNGQTSGTEHWPSAYVNVLMSAEYTNSRQRGDIDVDGVVAVAGVNQQGTSYGPYEPQDIRAVLASWARVDPDDLVTATVDPNDPDSLTKDLATLESELLP